MFNVYMAKNMKPKFKRQCYPTGDCLDANAVTNVLLDDPQSQKTNLTCKMRSVSFTFFAQL